MHNHSQRSSLAFALGLAALLAFGGILAAVPAGAAPLSGTPWSSPQAVAVSTYNNGYSTIVTDAKGYTYVFYLSQNPSVLSTVFLNVTRYYDHYPPSIFGPAVQAQGTWTVNATGQTPLWGSSPSAALDPSTGALYVAWSRSGAVSGSQTIILSKSTNGGQTWTSAVVRTLSLSRSNDKFPALAVAPSGTVYVAFIENWTTGLFTGLNSVAVASSTNGGASFGAATNISVGSLAFLSGTTFSTPSLAVDSQSRAYLAYGTESFSLFLNYANASVSWSDGGAWSAPAQVSSKAAWGDNPTVAVDAHDGVHVVWQDYRQVGGENTVHQRASRDRGATWGADELVMSGGFTVDQSARPIVASFANTVQITFVGHPADNIFFWTWSQDAGLSWSGTAGYFVGSPQPAFLRTSSGGNNTYWITYTDTGAPQFGVYFQYWEAPPSTPVITSITPGSGSLTVTWAPSPETDVSYYLVSRSASGATFNVVADVAAPTTSIVDSGLANGTYFYTVVAVNALGVGSQTSIAVSGTVGPTTQQLINQLQDEITALQGQLAQSSANLTAARAQITALQNALTNLQNSQATSNAATSAALAQLQANITALQNQLNNLQSQQATQTISYANLAFEVIVVVLLVVLLLNQMRKPKAPQMMMAEPSQTPHKPEDDL